MAGARGSELRGGLQPPRLRAALRRATVHSDGFAELAYTADVRLKHVIELWELGGVSAPAARARRKEKDPPRERLARGHLAL